MNPALLAVIAFVVAFAVGAIPFGVLVSRAFYGTDIRSEGSGNIGAANALRTLGKRGAASCSCSTRSKDSRRARRPECSAARSPAAAPRRARSLGHCWSPFLALQGRQRRRHVPRSVVALWWPAGRFRDRWIAAVLACGYASVGSMLASLAMAPVALVRRSGRSGSPTALVSARR